MATTRASGARSAHGEAISNPKGICQGFAAPNTRYTDIDGNDQLPSSSVLHAPFPVYDVRTSDGADQTGIAVF